VIRVNDLSAERARDAAAVDARLARVLAHGAFILGPEVAELEAELARFVGVEHAIAVKSGTMALELCLRALDVGPGDEVITTAFSWISAAEAIALVGATPIFVDIEPSTFLLDPGAVEAAITPRTRAIIPVSLFGQMPDLEAMNELGRRYGLPVIEDGAQSFGATRHGKRSCGVTTLGVTSFFPTKPLGCYGDGGAVLTGDGALGRKVRTLRDHGAETRGEHKEIGLNGRLDTLQAAVLLAKLPHVEARAERRRLLAERYGRAFGGRLLVPATAPGNVHVYAQYTLRLRDRELAARALASAGIETAVHYRSALHQQPVFHDPKRTALPQAERAAREVLSLPIHAALRDEQQAAVIAAVQALLEQGEP
jgi:UDP-2-acetamido-2-deoxy-ribo-hexuluronate aminotransferase